MLDGIVKVTKVTKVAFEEALDIPKNMHSPRILYDIYRSLEKVLENISLLSEHYLALDFSEEYSQLLSYIKFEDEHKNILGKVFSAKTYYGFIRDDYNVGYVEHCGTTMMSLYLDLKAGSDLYNIQKFKKTE